MLAQSAARAGLRASSRSIYSATATRARRRSCGSTSAAGPLSIDVARLTDALARSARLPGLIGWIDGSGLEPFIAQLCSTPGLPRFIGNSVDASAQVRDPRRFFALLDELEIPHPQVAFTRPRRRTAG